MTRRKSFVVQTAAAIACGVISYLVVRAFAAGDEPPRLEHIYGTAPP